jgi:hypothetical protein
MTDLNKLSNRPATYNLHFVGPRFGDKIRRITGLGINVLGAGVLLADGIRLFGWSL